MCVQREEWERRAKWLQHRCLFIAESWVGETAVRECESTGRQRGDFDQTEARGEAEGSEGNRWRGEVRNVWWKVRWQYRSLGAEVGGGGEAFTDVKLLRLIHTNKKLYAPTLLDSCGSGLIYVLYHQPEIPTILWNVFFLTILRFAVRHMFHKRATFVFIFVCLSFICTNSCREKQREIRDQWVKTCIPAQPPGVMIKRKWARAHTHTRTGEWARKTLLHFLRLKKWH